MKKRGQITIFMILGIVLLIAFGFIFFVRNVFYEARIQEESQSKLQQIFQSDAFETHTSSCLNEVSKDAVLLIGKQGGNIYESQGGMVPEPKTLPIQDANVSYGLTWEPQNPDFLKEGFFVSVPEYPRLDDIEREAYYGNNNLPYLCQEGGPNQILEGGIRRKTCTFVENKVDSTFKEGYGDHSIQEQLSYYISNKLKECIDLSDIESLKGILLEEGDYNVTTIFGADNIIIHTTIPVVVNEDGRAVTKEAKFSTDLNVRLKKVYELAYTMVEFDRRFLKIEKNDSEDSSFFDMLQNLNKLKSGFIIDIRCPYCGYEDELGYNYDDLIKITDTNSKIEREDFVFMFVIENRWPALAKVPSEGSYPTYSEPELAKYDVVIGTDRKIYLDTKAKDPDEDLLNYTYEGWRETTYTEFDPECCIQYRGSINCRTNYEECLKEYSYPPREDKWTDSDEYKRTKREASYETDIFDIGKHEVIVRVKDEAGYSDWQDVNIFVVDTPIAKPTGFNDYNDIPDLNASIEDPYYLDAKDSISLLLPLKIFNWDDSRDDFSILNSKEDIQIVPHEDFNIDDIKDKGFTTLGKHTIYLTTSNLVSTSPEESFDVVVYDCLPHRSSDIIYPYNSGDEFQADHTCCRNDFMYEDTSKNCYTYIEYGTIDYFRRYPLTNETVPGSTGVIQEEIGFTTDEQGYQNDVYMRTFKRNCSGKRGNYCNGPASIQITLVDECHIECESPGGFFDSDDGPSNNYIDCEPTASDKYIEIDSSGDGFTTLDGAICQNCGNTCIANDYQNLDGPCCRCLRGTTTCDPGFESLGPTYERGGNNCDVCCGNMAPECELNP
jgi:hypothetical protein